MFNSKTRGRRGSGGPQQMVIQITPVVKALMIINIAIWLVAVIGLQNSVFKDTRIFNWFGLVPQEAIFSFRFWQPFTYLFLHSAGITHILFNMLLLWWVGSQIEITMGSKRFLKYYLVCGVGAGLLYLSVVQSLSLLFGIIPQGVLYTPVVGASGAIFGLMLAFAIFHGEEIVYFMMIFPMRAKYFVGLLILIELFVLTTSGLSGPVANLAHLGGVLVGFVYLYFQMLRKKRAKRKWFRKNGRRLKLVVDNDKKKTTYH